jgi:acyloxyacyl hydrolase
MTTPPQFEANVLQSLLHLEKILPNNSLVIFIGIVDGRVLWNTLHNELHPIGTPYSRLYDYLNCLGINPCFMWLNSNETFRNLASKRAEELNRVYLKIIRERKFSNFRMYYQPFPMIQVSEKLKKEGKSLKDFIEPVSIF